MNVVRHIRLVVLVVVVIALGVSLSAAPAEAGGHHHFHHVHKVHNFYPSHFYSGHYCSAAYQPIVKYVVRPYSYPVTLIDGYGQTYVVWQSGYQTLPATYLPY
jgi:hypothetical protein